MSEEKRGFWLWDRLRKEKRRSLDRIQRDMVKGQSEKREYAGDPQQPEHFRVKTKNK